MIDALWMRQLHDLERDSPFGILFTREVNRHVIPHCFFGNNVFCKPHNRGGGLAMPAKPKLVCGPAGKLGLISVDGQARRTSAIQPFSPTILVDGFLSRLRYRFCSGLVDQTRRATGDWTDFFDDTADRISSCSNELALLGKVIRLFQNVRIAGAVYAP
jgi:hypothetical protein